MVIGLSATAAVLHVLALRFGPLTVVQPLGALTLVLALGSDQIVVLTIATGVALITLATWASAMSNVTGRSLGYASAAGVSFGVSSALTQTVTVDVSGDGMVGLLSTASVVVVVLVTCGLLFSQAAYRAGLGAPLATVTSVNPITAAVIGVALLGERYAAVPLCGP